MVSLEPSPGSIVWVRRRNGSWWPGKILNTDEVSDSLVMSPRVGTPVQLLGKEYASVDWYNLERSKRVKAFRCGDFDNCIEMVESSHGRPAKRREKYARRKDAILHALELEREMLEKKNVGDLQSVAACRAKRSKCVYVPVESDSPVESETPSACADEDDEVSSSATESIKTESDADTTVSGSDKEDEVADIDHSDYRHLSPISSKWNIKGKRNVRSMPRKPVDESGIRPGGTGENTRTSSTRIRNFSSRFDDYETCLYEPDAQDPRKTKKHTGKRRTSYPSRSIVRRIVDVDLTVQASYQEHVPIVSLLSKYNGNAIIGHPIQVQVLEDGSCEVPVIPPVWKTARRTANFRVPRLRPVSAIECHANGQAKRAGIPHGGQKTNPSRRNVVRRAAKTVSFAPSKKTRTLSSLASERMGGNEVEPGRNPNNVAKGRSWGTDCACVPVKVAFGRIFEGISRTKPV